jgi:hypothetical protein
MVRPGWNRLQDFRACAIARNTSAAAADAPVPLLHLFAVAAPPRNAAAAAAMISTQLVNDFSLPMLAKLTIARDYIFGLVYSYFFFFFVLTGSRIVS